MKQILKIKSQFLIGITKDHNADREDAPMYSTGNLVFDGECETDPRSWYIEYKCSVCNELVYQGNPDLFDLVRAALKENGILKNT
jgi:hypothetical protein